MSLLTDRWAEDARRTPTGSDPEEAGTARSAMTEASTLQWPGDRQVAAKGDRSSVRSDASLREAASWTESERELMAKTGGAGEDERAGLLTEAGAGKSHLEEEKEEPIENHLPEKAAQVFSPTVTVLHCPSSPRESEAFWEMERVPFLAHNGVDQNSYQHSWAEDPPPARCGRGCQSRDALKAGVSLMTSALFFPFLVWGGYVFLPFDAPLLDSAPLRLVYTLRCSVFAATPIVLGWLVLGVSRVRFGAVRPLFDVKAQEAGLQQVAVHQRFLTDSASLFLIYFLQLVTLAMYLSQEQLKLVPLLAIVFAIGRLVYWVAAAFGSSIRGFGFGFSFLPCLVMFAANAYFIFTVEASGSIFSLPPPPEEAMTAPAGRRRFWG